MDHIKCYVCGFGIHRANDALACLLGVSWQELKAVKPDGTCLRDRYTLANADAYRERVAQQARRDPLPWSTVKAYQNLLLGYRSDRMQWLLDRGLTAKTIRDAHLGHTGTAFTIPVLDKNGKCVAIRYRADEQYLLTRDKGGESPKYWGDSGRNGTYLYGEHWLGEANHVVVTESELCALRLHQEGIPAVSPTNGAGQLGKVAELLTPFSTIQRVYIAADMDKAGREGARLLTSALKKLGVRYIMLEWSPRLGKDVTELLQGGHRLESVGYNAGRL